MADVEKTVGRKKCQSDLNFEHNRKIEHRLSVLATKVMNKELSPDAAYEKIITGMENSNWDENTKAYWLERWECHLNYQRTPSDAIKKIFQYAESIKMKCGERAKYPIWVSVEEHRKTMYLLMLILGAWGREFLFGAPAIAALSKVAIGSVQRFVDTAKRTGFIKCVWQNLKGNSYRLARKEDHLAWCNVPQAVGVEGFPDARDEIIDRFFWMFDSHNPLNRAALEEYAPDYLEDSQRSAGEYRD